MEQNESNLDRAIRMIAGAAMITLHYSGLVPAPAGTIMVALGLILVFTGTTGFSPLYAHLKINTACPEPCKNEI